MEGVRVQSLETHENTTSGGKSSPTLRPAIFLEICTKGDNEGSVEYMREKQKKVRRLEGEYVYGGRRGEGNVN